VEIFNKSVKIIKGKGIAASLFLNKHFIPLIVGTGVTMVISLLAVNEYDLKLKEYANRQSFTKSDISDYSDLNKKEDIAFFQSSYGVKATFHEEKLGSPRASLNENTGESTIVLDSSFRFFLSTLPNKMTGYRPEILGVDALVKTQEYMYDELSTDAYAEDLIFESVASHHEIDSNWLRQNAYSGVTYHEGAHAVDFDHYFKNFIHLEDEGLSKTNGALIEYVGDKVGLRTLLLKMAIDDEVNFNNKAKAILDIWILFRMRTSFEDTHVGSLYATDQMAIEVSSQHFNKEYVLSQYSVNKNTDFIRNITNAWQDTVEGINQPYDPSKIKGIFESAFTERTKNSKATFSFRYNQKLSWLEAELKHSVDTKKASLDLKVKQESSEKSILNLIGDFRKEREPDPIKVNKHDIS